MPDLYLFGGCNGAGKTTIALELLPELDCRQFLNADSIARALSPFDVDAVAFQAGALMMRRVRLLADKAESFASESTLSARAWAPFINDSKARGYTFNLIYVWLPSADMAVERVKARVLSGGHDISEDVIRRRYEKGRKNFIELYSPLADNWKVIDNSKPHQEIVAFRNKSETQILEAQTWQQILR